MSRTSSPALSVVTTLKPAKHPPPPRELSARQRELWTLISKSKSPDWWDAGSTPVLRALVAHIETFEVFERQFSDLGDLSDRGAVERLDKLSRLRDRESKAVAALSAKLRLTQQSRYTAQSAATAAKRNGGARPWDDATNKFSRNGVKPK